MYISFLSDCLLRLVFISTIQDYSEYNRSLLWASYKVTRMVEVFKFS